MIISVHTAVICSVMIANINGECPENPSNDQPPRVLVGNTFGGRTGRWKSRGRGWKRSRGGSAIGGPGQHYTRPHRSQPIDDADNLCGIIFVRKRFTAKILYHLFYVSLTPSLFPCFVNTGITA